MVPRQRDAGPSKSFLYIHAADVTIHGVRFEKIDMPIISADSTEGEDWGDNLKPRVGYKWNKDEFAVHHYNQDLVNLRVIGIQQTRRSSPSMAAATRERFHLAPTTALLPTTSASPVLPASLDEASSGPRPEQPC